MMPVADKRARDGECQAIIDTLPSEEQAIYRLVHYSKFLGRLAAQAASGEPAGPGPSDPEHDHMVKEIVAAAGRWIGVRDRLDRENRLEAVLSSLQQRGLISPDDNSHATRLLQ